jgi:hypothetical protein
MDFGTLWGGLSYRRSIDGAQYTSGNGISKKITIYYPIVGVNFNNLCLLTRTACSWCS